ncbi:3-isopropylmalate dehydrogenase [Aquabacter sp. L1I39]|uniref:3-isopropylmalate dehydrogenase n=1 Tax=Aquabacter TaxID=45402 RepID=UPI001ADB5EA0|nr:MULTISPECIES: 3-isopropylmalate dehydrogenase [unclassified Aquabacter]MDE1569227.1 3-isopropylmalate dehydrogenase [Aquabacter sp. P-9]QTL01803.1 3-isopropylmalate dehydrogenase [Aquabacter sp. L1I39]
MATHKLLLLPGDGIGPEVMAQVKRVIAALESLGLASFAVEEDLVGGCAYDAHGAAISEAAMDKAKAADAVLLGAVGGPKWASVPYEARPEAGLLRLRKDLALFANLRPALCYPALADSSSLKREVVEGLDILIVRELTGGVYFGEPKTITDLGNGQKRAIDTQVYDTYEIERIGRVAFELARTRRNKVTSSEKHNVMRSGVLWKEVITALHARDYADVELEHNLADSLAMQLVRWPKQFDVIVTDNLFGDILSDIAAMLTGSLGMLPSASLGAVDETTGKRAALYEPVHGSAPDIAGKGLANPIAMIGSLAMALRYSFGQGDVADRIEAAIAQVLADGKRTADIRTEGSTVIGTEEMGSAIIEALKA